MSIRILPVNISSQISAGEIIERPSSVVKELMENSIDAGSKNIHVCIEKGGLRVIYIKDDGWGIKKKELLLAISRHATSKIDSLKDLYYLDTFGFRGEALAGIRAVSRLTLISSTKYHACAWKIYSEGYQEKKIDIQPIAHPLGTSIFVEDLFYNIPVRLRFLQSIKQEYIKIYNIFNSIALSHFHINFVLLHNNKIIARYNDASNENMNIRRLEQIFPFIDINKLLEIQKKYNNIKIYGWISLPTHNDSVKKIQYYYVNNRYIYNTTIHSAVGAAYKNYFKKNINFFCVLYLHLPPNEIDVNVHPTKKDIKFHNSDIVFQAVYTSILNRFNLYFSIYKPPNFVFVHKKCVFHSSFSKDIQMPYASPIMPMLKNKRYSENLTYKKNFNLINKKRIFIQLLIIFQRYYGLIHVSENFLLISFPFAKTLISQLQLKKNIKKNIVPVLMPTHIKIEITLSEYIILFDYTDCFLRLGIHLIFKKKYVIIQTIPIFLKREDIKRLILNILKYLKSKKNLSILNIIDQIYMNIKMELKHWHYSEGYEILLKIENCYPFLLISPPKKLLQKIDIHSALCMLKI